MSKDDSILFGAKRAGITWLFKFTRWNFKRAKAGAKKLGMSLAEFLCRCQPLVTGASELPEPKTFTDADEKTSTLKIQITECDPFTRRCLERQAALYEWPSVEEYILNSVFNTLVNDEENAIYDPETGDALLYALDTGDLVGFHVDKGAQGLDKDHPWHGSSGQVKRLPAGTIVEQSA